MPELKITFPKGVETEKVKNLYVGGNLVSISADVEKGLYVGGNVVTVDGDVEDHLFIGGSTVMIRGDVGGTIHAGGGTVVIDGAVTDDLFVGGGTVTISKSASIGGDLIVGGGHGYMEVPFKGKVLFKTKYNEYFGENFKVYSAADFIAALTQHIPPARVHLVRYYGLYSSRSRGIWKDMSYVIRLAPDGWIERQKEQETIKEDAEDIGTDRQEVKSGAKRSAWARLINKVYGINPLICEKCGSEMIIVSFIMDPEQIEKIMHHLKKQGREPPPIFA